MTDQDAGARPNRVKVTLSWKVNGHDITSPDRLSDVINQPKRRRAEATRKIKAHVKAHVGPRASFAFANKEELIPAQISAPMGAEALGNRVDALPVLKYNMGPADQNSKVEVSFGDVTSGGRRRGKTRRNRKARSTRRR